MLLPSFKDKLPGDLSYPIGAEGISAALAGSSHFDSLKLSFCVHADIFMSSFRKTLAEARPITIASVSYRHVPITRSSANSFIDEGWHDEHWSLDFYSVPRRYKAIARQAVERAFPKIREWLDAPRQEVWRYGRHQLSVMMQFPDGELLFDET